MDNLCHTLVGAALAEAGLKRRTARAYATLLIGANFPDLDVLAVFTDHALGFRRGLTHGIPALLLLPLALTGLVVLWDRWRPGPDGPPDPRRLLGIAALAIATHPVLDWLNVYGMRWLMPFSGRWFYGDALFIVDPLVWGVLGGGVLVARILGRSAAAKLALGLAVAYVAGMLTLSTVGRRVAARDLGLAAPGPRVLMVGPVFLNPYRREVVVDAGDRYRFGEIEWLPAPALRFSSREVAKAAEGITPDALALDGRAVEFLDWARFPFYTEEGDQVRIDDARYSRGGRSWAGVTVRRGLPRPVTAR